MHYRLKAPLNVVVGASPPVALKAGVVTPKTEEEARALELAATLGLAEEVEVKADAAES